MSEKNYAPVNIREKTFDDGGSILKMSFNPTKFIEWIKAASGGQEVITIGISRRRKIGEKQQTHCAYLDKYPPKNQQDEPSSRPATESDFAGLRQAVENPKPDDEVPF